MKTCIACGMPMKTKNEYAMGDETKEYCIYCAKEDGSMQSYDEKLESMTAFIVKTQGITKEAASDAAKSMMSNLPAWKK